MSENNNNSKAAADGLLEYPLEFRIDNGSLIVCDKGVALIGEDTLVLTGSSGSSFSFALRDIDNHEGKNYRIFIEMRSAGKLELFYLGYQYENFLNALTSFRNSAIKRGLLMHESLLFSADEIEFDYYDDQDHRVSSGACNAQVSDTALITAAPDGNHLKFPLSYVRSLHDENYTLNICMDTGERIVLRMLGRQREPLLLNLEKAIERLEDKAVQLCQSLFGSLGFPKEAAALFKDGRAVTKHQLDGYSRVLWPEMEKRLAAFGLSEKYQALTKYGDMDYASIGFKRGLMGDLTGEYLWFLIPVKAKQVIALESGSTAQTGGQATYFFRMPEALDENHLEAFIHQINYCLFMINFRREPIYLSEEQLQKPSYSEYLYSIERIPALRVLRKLFAGRIVHATAEQWEKDVNELIQRCGKNMDKL